jgi:adenylate cyclase
VTFAFGDHELDIERRELRRGGTPVAIEPQVFDLLIHLIRNRDRVVSKDDLIESIWGGRIVSESAVTTRLNAARRAVGDTGAAQSLIRTVPRRGVRFVGEVTERSAPVAAERAVPLPVTEALALPDKSSIAVLPFANMSNDPDQEYFSDGIAEDIITALSRYHSLFVIARNSSFTYKGQIVNAKDVGRDLGVRYILEGSVRKSDHRIRLTAQLIDAETANHVWAANYDREISDIFAVQDEITRAVTTAIAPAIADAELKRAMRARPGGLDPWAAYQRGLWHLGKVTAADNRAARQFFQQTIDLDPAFAGGYRGLALALFDAAIVHHEQDLARVLRTGEALIRRAVELDGADAEAHAWLGRAFVVMGDYEGGLSESRRALAMNPNLASAHGVLGAALMLSGHPRAGLESLETSIILGPRDPFLHVRSMQVAMAHYFCRDYPAAVDAAKAALRSYPDFALSYFWLAAGLAQIGLIAEAKDALARVAAVAPASFDLYVRRRVPWIRQQDHDHLLQGLRMAGWER